MQRQDDLRQAAQAGFEYCGFIFHPASPRFVKPEIVAGLETWQMKRVGVFVKNSIEEILAIMKTGRLDYAQLHGDFAPQDASRIGAEKIIKVLWPDRYQTSGNFEEECQKWHMACAYFLLDAGHAEGGSGKTVRAEYLSGTRIPKPWFLAGGLNAANLAEKLSTYSPDGVDVNSGVEDQPGHKNHSQLTTFAALCKGRNK